MLKLGIPTFMEFNSVEEHLEFCKQHGFDFIELSFYYPWTQSDQFDLKKLSVLKEKYNIGFSLHLADIDPFSFSPEIRKAGFDSVSYVIDVAASCGARILNMHLNPGGYSSIKGTKHYFYDHYKKQYFANIEKFVETFSPLLKKNGCTLCIENTKGYKDFQKEALDILLKDPNFGLTFDIGHNYKASEDDEKYIVSHKNSLKHFHIHDVNPTSNHIALGQGVIDINHYLDFASEVGASALIEVKSPECLIQSAEYLKDKGYM